VYNLCITGGPGLPYFRLLYPGIGDTPGLDPITADFELEPGLEVQGRLLAPDGKPVAGRVLALNLPDNPNVKDFSDHAIPGGAIVGSDWVRTDKDGRFRLPAIPGPGVLVVQADQQKRFALIDPIAELFVKRKIGRGVGGYLNAVVSIEPSAGKPKSLRRDIVLEPGRSLAGKVVGPDGKPVLGAYVAGLGEFDESSFPLERKAEPLKGAAFTVHGLNPRYPRTLVFFHREKKLARVVPLRGEKEPLVVRLEPLGTVRGRLVSNPGGAPVAGASVSARLYLSRNLRFGDLAALNLPVSEFHNSELGRLLEADVKARGVKTDSRPNSLGEFRLEGLVPGLPYDLELYTGGRPAHQVTNLVLDVTRERALGDLKVGTATRFNLGKPAPKGGGGE
jgi:hypothetical protein